MNERRRKQKGVVKGTSSAVVLSILIHVGLFLLAGALVVFTVVKSQEVEFEPPQAVERPKMKLKKPKVRVKKNTRPKSAARIATTAKRSSMPVIELPDLGGIGDGLGDGLGGEGFDMMPDLEKISFLGMEQSIGSDLEGTFYDFNRRANGNTYTIGKHNFITELAGFISSGWKPARLNRYYRSPKKLYTTTIAVPPIPSPLAPAAFGEPDNMDYCWMVHYTGQIVHKDGIKFRFAGNADDIIVVAVNKEVVFNGSRGWGRSNNRWYDCAPFSSTSADDRKWIKCHDYCAVGNVVELEPGVPVDIDILFAEVPGGQFNAFLCVMEEGVEYEHNHYGEPVLPLFKTAEYPRALADMIYRGMPGEEVCVTNGPIFNDYEAISTGPVEDEAATDERRPAEAETRSAALEFDVEGLREWTRHDGAPFSAELVTVMNGRAVMKTPGNGQKKIPLELFSEEDRRKIELSRPPGLKLDFSKKTRARPLKYGAGKVRINEYTFTAKIYQTSVGDYNHRLDVEFFALGSENGGNKYILLDRAKASFNPAETEDRSYRFSGRTVDTLDYNIYGMRRGEEYDGFVITVADERGKVVAHRSVPEWIYPNLQQLKQLPIGSFFDKACARAWPTPLRSR